jgi:hypothetical protein
VPAPKAEAPAPEAKPRPRITAPPVAIPDAAPAEEVELAWHGYSAAALLPGTLILAALTAGAVFGLRSRLPATVLRDAVDAPLAALWLVQAVRVAYRLLAYQYRLTTRRLFRSRGPLYPPDEPLDLATVARVEVAASPAGALVGVGTVRVVPEEGSGHPPLDLPAVRRPKALAAAIEQAAAAAREGTVVAVHLG